MDKPQLLVRSFPDPIPQESSSSWRGRWRRLRPTAPPLFRWVGPASALGATLIGLTLGLSACSSRSLPSASTPVRSGALPTLRIAVLPAYARAEQERIIAPLDAHLEKVLGQQVDFLFAENYEDNVKMLLDGRANAAYTGPAIYLEARDRGARIQPLAAPIDERTKRPWYRAAIIVASNGPIQTLADLKGKRIAFVAPTSTSGYLVPLAALTQVGLKPTRDFAAVVFGGNHTKTVALLETGKVDACATSLDSYRKQQASDQPTVAQSRVLWQSDPIPHSPFVISEDLPPELVEKLKEALLTVPPNLQDILGTPLLGYTLVTATDYEPIQQLRVQLRMAKDSPK